MRLVAGVLALSLFASFARAEDTRTAEPPARDVTHGKVPLRVVRIMSDSHQALLFDRDRATHVLAEIGGKIDGYTIEAIDDDEVTLSVEGKQIVLAAPAHGGSRRHDRDRPAMHVRSAAAARQTDTIAANPTPVDPYGEVAIRVVEAPGAADREPSGHVARAIEAGEGGVRVAEAPSSPSPGNQAPDNRAPATTREVRAPEPTPSGVRAADAARAPDSQTLDARALADVMSADSRPRGPRSPRPAIPMQPTSEIRTVSAAPADAVVLTRAEVNAALADFAKLATAVHGSFSASGLVIDGVSDGTIFQHAGLRAGDVITAVDGARLRSLDDAADLYARASTSKALTAQLLRGGRPMTLRLSIQ